MNKVNLHELVQKKCQQCSMTNCDLLVKNSHCCICLDKDYCQQCQDWELTFPVQTG